MKIRAGITFVCAGFGLVGCGGEEPEAAAIAYRRAFPNIQ